jgi:hypothetical protein
LEKIDWPLLLETVDRHQVSGLVYSALTVAVLDGIPPSTRDALAQRVARQTRHGLRLMAETLRINGLMTAAGVDAAFVKGAALAMEVYGSVALRYSMDIDAVVMPYHLNAAVAVLERAGYRRVDPAPDLPPRQTLRAMRYLLSLGFRHAESGVMVELHWRLSHNLHLAVPLPPPHAWESIALASGQTVRTLPQQLRLAYLCHHGAQHAWQRFKWVADIAAMLAQSDAAQLEELLRTADSDGTWRPVGQALLLVADLLALDLPADIGRRVLSDPAIRWLADNAVQVMMADARRSTSATRLIHLSHYHLRKNWRYLLAELRSDLFCLDDLTELPLPGWLDFLYPLLRLPLWGIRSLRAALRGGR